MMLRRRTALLGLASTFALGAPSLAFAQAPSQKRFVAVILRGALDGLSAVVPYGDADLRTWRAPLVPPEPDQQQGLLDLGGFWGLHPALSNLHKLYAAGEALPVHAVIGPTHSRSHFEAQDFLECGADQRMTSGWLNRLAGYLPTIGTDEKAVALGQNVPLLLRGPVAATSWAPGAQLDPGADFYEHLLSLHAADPLTGPALANGLQERGFTSHVLANPASSGGEPAFLALSRAAGRFLAAPNGPRLATLEIDGWDTHAAQAPRLSAALKSLDDGLLALRESLSPVWNDTVILVMTEFGRTVRVNGTKGTDHGTATVAFLLGGKVNGGKVRADWPGLAEHQLFENRDLQPTTDLRALIKGALAPHFGLKTEAFEKIFPDSSGIMPLADILRA